LNGGAENEKNVRFQRKTGHISKTVRDMVKVTINQMRWPWINLKVTNNQYGRLS